MLAVTLSRFTQEKYIRLLKLKELEANNNSKDSNTGKEIEMSSIKDQWDLWDKDKIEKFHSNHSTKPVPDLMISTQMIQSTMELITEFFNYENRVFKKDY